MLVIAALVFALGVGTVLVWADDDDAASGVALVDAGGPIAGGFRVAEGSTLLGAAFPNPDAYLTYASSESVPEVEEAWDALVRVDGNPVDVLNDYLAQVEDQGLVVSDVACRLRYLRGPEGTLDEALLTSPELESEDLRGLECEATAWVVVDDFVRERAQIRLRRSAGDARYESWLQLSYGRWAAGSAEVLPVMSIGDALVPFIPAALSTGVPGPPAPVPPTPSTGEPITETRDTYPYNIYRLIDVQPGMQLLGPAAFVGGCGGSMFEVVAQMDDDRAAEAALDTYAGRFEEMGYPLALSEGRFDGAAFEAGTVSEGGLGSVAVVVLHATGSRPTLLHVSHCGD